MHLFLYEYVTGGGWFEQSEPASRSLVREGSAMVNALAVDFAQLAGVELSVMRDSRLPTIDGPLGRNIPVSSAQEHAEVFDRLAETADWTLVIAPETGGALLRRATAAEAVGGRLLSPPPAFVERASNKQRTAEVLAKAGIAVPLGLLLSCESRQSIFDLGFPLIAKPVDGCGSCGIQLVRCEDELEHLPVDGTIRLERYVRGQPASVAVLCGPAGDHALPATRQQLSRDGRFTYFGGALPLTETLNRRAKTLAMAAVSAFGPRVGYVGVDLVLGEDPSESTAYVIEINPRLTTSYVGLRAAAKHNLAAAMLAVASGGQPDLRFDERTIKFTADGQIRSRQHIS